MKAEKTVIKTLPAQKNWGSDGFMGKFYQTSKEYLIPLFLKLLEKMKREHFQTHFMRPASPWYQRETKMSQGKKNTCQYP